MSSTFTHLELAVLQATLAGAHPALERLRKQLEVARVKSREHTGVGFFTEIAVAGSRDLAIKTSRAIFGDVDAEIPGVPHGAGFVVFVEHGFITMLEGYVYEGSWPTDVSQFTLKYTNDTRDLDAFGLK